MGSNDGLQTAQTAPPAIDLRNDFTRRGARRGSSTRQHRARRAAQNNQRPWAPPTPPAAVVQRLQEEHLRKDVIGYGSLGEALAAQGGRAEEASKAFDDALACCPAGVPPHLQRAYAHYCGAYAALCEERGDRQRARSV